MAENDKLRIPFPDPLGVLKELTKGMPVETFDPLKNAGEMFRRGREGSVLKEDSNDYVDEQVRMYKYHVQEALKHAPCPGCRKIQISALVAVRIYEEMVKGGKKREEFTQDEIDRIKKEIEEKYGR